MLSERERAFVWRDGERTIRFGSGVVAEVPSLLGEHGFDGYALLSTPRALRSSGAATALAASAAAVLEVPPGDVPGAASAVRGEVRGRPIVALGGGRVIDAAKAVAAVDGLRCAAIPTTLSGADVTAIHRLPAGAGAPPRGLVRPDLTVADPDLMASAPRPALTASAMNALAHGAEALYAPGANPVGEMAALRGAALISAGLKGSPGVDRAPLALGAVLCAWAIGGSGLGLHHAICQSLVRATGSPHAETNAVVLPHVLRHLAPHAVPELGQLAVALGASEPDPAMAADRASALAQPSGVRRLWEIGVDASELEAVVRAIASRPELATAPGQPGPEEVRELLEAAL